MPTKDDDNDHDEIVTSTVAAIITTIPPQPETSESSVAIPTDHPERPTKPGSQGDASPTATGSSATPTTAENETGTESAADEAATTPGSSWVPSFLPTFGVSARTQAWIYGSLGLMAVFCCGLGAWLWWARRKRLRNNPLDKYEFEPLNPNDTDGPHSGSRGAEKGPGGGRRGGELYDAFAGGSEDEDDLDDLVSPLPRSARSSTSSDGDDDEEEDVGNAKRERSGSRLLTGAR